MYRIMTPTTIQKL